MKLKNEKKAHKLTCSSFPRLIRPCLIFESVLNCFEKNISVEKSQVRIRMLYCSLHLTNTIGLPTGTHTFLTNQELNTHQLIVTRGDVNLGKN